MGDRSLVTYEYAANNGYLVKQTDADGNPVTFTYDHLGRVKQLAPMPIPTPIPTGVIC